MVLGDKCRVSKEIQEVKLLSCFSFLPFLPTLNFQTEQLSTAQTSKDNQKIMEHS